MFGGLGICSLEAVVGKDGKENIIEVNDSATTLLGESQEEDRRNISELVFAKMEVRHFKMKDLPWYHILSRRDIFRRSLRFRTLPQKLLPNQPLLLQMLSQKNRLSVEHQGNERLCFK
jgi:hypothetical protein